LTEIYSDFGPETSTRAPIVFGPPIFRRQAHQIIFDQKLFPRQNLYECILSRFVSDVVFVLETDDRVTSCPNVTCSRRFKPCYAIQNYMYPSMARSVIYVYRCVLLLDGAGRAHGRQVGSAHRCTPHTFVGLAASDNRHVFG
jgi:hypothetical protein